MHDDTPLIRTRIQRLLDQRIAPAMYREKAPVSLTSWAAPGEPVPFTEAQAQTYTPIANGDRWGRPWGTTWFNVTGQVPSHWAQETDATPELITDIGFTLTQTGFQCEATAYDDAGTIIKAVEPYNRYVTLPAGTDSVSIHLEASSNPDVINEWTFVPTEKGRWDTSGDELQYRLTEISLGLKDHEVTALYDDLTVLLGLSDVLDQASSRRGQIYGAFAECLRVMDPANIRETAAAGRAALASAMGKVADASAHTVYAVGHAHIDSAWLWPIRETARKVARTFSNALDLIGKDEDFVFSASSAQQYAWVKEQYPELFERIRQQVAEGRFVPVGGMWVESDTNLPGGEALVRQFVRGARFFREEFDIDQPEVWLPDSFGYSAALPQIMRLAGAKWFLTQKISWNQVNRMPHHTFWWEGIDGSQIFTHFPPVDSYASDLSAVELKRAEDQYAEKALGTTSLVPYGYGDGGGGPTREMVAIAHRKENLEGSPKVVMASPRSFFEKAQSEYPDPPVWSGELYLEIHRGTYTSQARTKQGNRSCESLLRQAELWAATAVVKCGAEYPYEKLDQAWQTVLLHQFHDILPGTCIGWVHDEVERKYAVTAALLEEIIIESLTVLVGEGNTELVANAGPLNSKGVSGLGIAAGESQSDAAAVEVERAGEQIVITTDRIRATIDADGTISSLVDLQSGREAFAPEANGNQLQIFRDTPSVWDAWDIDIIDRLTERDLVSVEDISVTENLGEAIVNISRRFSNSSVRQELRFSSGASTIDIKTTVDWHEQEKMLKLAFPFDVRAEYAASEIQFGHIKRPLHTNTSWDVARFETVAHRWVHVGEPDYGFSLANDSVYGHDFGRSTRADGGTTTQARLSLLRAPLYPDPQSDQGEHTFNVRLRVGATVEEAVSDGYELNVRARTIVGGQPVEPLISIDNSAILVESVKLAEDQTGDVIIRLYESLGTRAAASVSSSFDWKQVVETDLHERQLADSSALEADGSGSDAHVSLKLRPFQIVTLRFSR